MTEDQRVAALAAAVAAGHPYLPQVAGAPRVASSSSSSVTAISSADGSWPSGSAPSTSVKRKASGEPPSSSSHVPLMSCGGGRCGV
ncbi:hypothetical protein MRX96_056861 [Rhipicephalus microplus]